MTSDIRHILSQSDRRRFMGACAAGLSLALTPAIAAAVERPLERARLSDDLAEQITRLDHLAGSPVGALGGNVVLITFFASWCPPCVAEFRQLRAIRTAYPETAVKIVAINLFEDWGGLSDSKRLRRFLDRSEPNFSVVRGEDSISRRFGGISRIPTLFVFDRRGRIAYRFENLQGAQKQHVTEGELRQIIDALL